jgi:HK97 gp10 family phage protein
MAELFNIQGLPELKAALMQLPKEIQGKVLADAVKPAAMMIRDRARDRAPQLTGLVKKAIVAYRARKSDPSRIIYEVGVTMKIRRAGEIITGSRKKLRQIRAETGKKAMTAFYWRFLEFGTKKMPARPFLRPAFEELKMKALEQIKDSLSAAIEKAAAKLGRR